MTPKQVPEDIQRRVTRTIHAMDGLRAQRRGLRSMGMGERYRDEIRAAMAPHVEVMREFVRGCRYHGVDIRAAIAAMREHRDVD